jgi:hypothetical protein
LKFIAQEDGSWCFVCALANCAIHLGREVPDLDEAKRIARCERGSAISRLGAVEFFGLPLLPIDDAMEVFDSGGIVSIMHPIFNGHCFFVFPDGDGSVSMVNSWLGPLVTKGIGCDELLPLIVPNFGSHWVVNEVY